MSTDTLETRPQDRPTAAEAVGEGEAAADAGLPWVSIVITNYNYAAYLRDSVESALAQDHAATEVIVADDGSTDDSLEVLSLLKDAHPELTLLLGANGGQAAAMNRGWQAARGEWVLFLDADDLLEPGAVSAALAAADPDDTLLQFYLRTVDREGRPLGLHPFCHVLESGTVYPQVFASGHFRFMPTSGNLFRRGVLEKILPMPEPQWRICADTYLVVAAACLGRVRTVPAILGSYRIHGANAWYRDSVDEDKQSEIMRNQLLLWDGLLRLRRAWPAACDDYTLLSLVRRVALTLHLHRARPPLAASDIAALRRHLMRRVLAARVRVTEKLLHALLVMSSGRSGARLFRWLYRAGSARLAAPGRHAWLSRTAPPAEVPELPLGRAVEFGNGGEGLQFLAYGFGATSNWKCWSSAERAGLAFRLPQGSGPLELTLDLLPFLMAPAVTAQGLEIWCGERKLHAAELKARTSVTLRLGPEEIGADGVVALEFRFPDASVPALFDPASNITRVTACALASLTARPLAQQPAAPPHPALEMGRSYHAAGLTPLLAQDAWDCSGELPRLHRRRGQLRFSLPNPGMARFVIRLGFDRVPPQSGGDWRVSADLPGTAKDSIDLRETDALLLVVPRGKAPEAGRFDVACQAYDILPYPGGDESRPGPRLSSLTLLPFDLVPGKLRLWRAHRVVDFGKRGDGHRYCISGWHAPDAGGCWSADTRAVLGGYLFEAPGPAFLTLRVGGWTGAGLPRQTLRLLVNGQVLAEQAVGASGTVLAVVPEAFIGKDRYLRIELECRHLASSGGPAPANAGLHLQSLCIEPLAPDPSGGSAAGLP